MPEASGSSVPAWPAFSAWNSHFTFDTASVEPMPTGLSSTTQPETGRPFFLPRRAISVLVGLAVVAEVARHFGRAQQPIDLGEIVVAGVDPEVELRHVFH